MSRIVPSQVVEIIDQLFPMAKKQEDRQRDCFSLDRGNQNELAAIVDLVGKIPSELIALEARDYVGLQLALTTIRTMIPVWQVCNYGLEKVQGYGHLNPISIIRNSLSKCPDQGVSGSISDLSFISDPEFRTSLRIDISSANQALQNGEWKAATVLAGAISEAFLLYVLQSIQDKDKHKISTTVTKLLSQKVLSKDPGNNLEKWTLHPFIEVARALGAIREETAQQARLAKDFRNLIHPGVSIRKAQVCNRGTALSALAALEHIEKDVSIFIP